MTDQAKLVMVDSHRHIGVREDIGSISGSGLQESRPPPCRTAALKRCSMARSGGARMASALIP
jgi:hypothetical protein